jgi:hypothetical protein
MSLKEARLKAAELTARRDLACPTVTEAAEQWLAERVHTTHRRPAVVEGYVRRAVLPALGSHRLRDVLPADIGKMVRDYRDEVSKVRRRCSGATLFRFHALATIVVLFLGVGSAGVQTEESSAYKCVFDAAYNTLSGAAPVRSQGLESMYVGHRVDFAFSRLPTATVTTDINSATMEPMDFVVHQRGGKSDGWMKRKQPNVLNLHSIM